MQRTLHPGGHHAIFPDAPECVAGFAAVEFAHISEAALTLEIEIGDRARNRDERPGQPAVAVHVFDQPIVG